MDIPSKLFSYNKFMISRLTGTISEKLVDRVVVDVGGLGYEVFLTATEAEAASESRPATYFIYEQLREDAHNLFGFTTRDAREFFVHLIGTSGVGPKVAMAILSATSLEQLKAAISSGDAELFRGVAGVGKKTAERIMIELKGKMVDLGPSSLSSSDSTYQALLGLGYSAPQAASAIAKLPPGLTDDQSRIKAALKELAK